MTASPEQSSQRLQDAYAHLIQAEERVSAYKARNSYRDPLPRHERAKYIAAINAAVDARSAYSEAQRRAKLERIHRTR